MSDAAKSEHERLFDEHLAELKATKNKGLALPTEERFEYICELLANFDERREAKQVGAHRCT